MDTTLLLCRIAAGVVEPRDPTHNALECWLRRGVSRTTICLFIRTGLGARRHDVHSLHVAEVSKPCEHHVT
jgi:hypothetical protein